LAPETRIVPCGLKSRSFTGCSFVIYKKSQIYDESFSASFYKLYISLQHRSWHIDKANVIQVKKKTPLQHIHIKFGTLISVYLFIKTMIILNYELPQVW